MWRPETISAVSCKSFKSFNEIIHVTCNAINYLLECPLFLVRILLQQAVLKTT
jgi:hypothetical protein